MPKKIDLFAGLTAAGLLFSAGPAMAYIGPGAGLSLLGALWGVIAAVVAALLFLLIWPLRKLLRRQHVQAQRREAERADPDATQIPTAIRHRR